MAFRTKLNINDTRLITKNPENPNNGVDVDSSTIVETNSVLDLDFQFISDSKGTTFKFNHNEFSLEGEEYSLNKNNITDNFLVPQTFFETNIPNSYSGVSFVYMITSIDEIAEGVFGGEGFTNEYNEYSAKGYGEETDIVIERPESTIEVKNYEITTETIVAEDNKIELNFGGTHESALHGGFVVINGVSDGVDSVITVTDNGGWNFYPGIKSSKIILPEINDKNIQELGSIQYDDEFLYINTSKGIKKVKLEDI